MTEQENYMAQALALAREAAAAGEVPVGCVIVRGGEIVGRGRNRREEKQSTASHAEMEAIAMANEVTGSWRLDDCTLYVTLEPCPMCAGAILNARIPRVYYGARDRAMGAESLHGAVRTHPRARRRHPRGRVPRGAGKFLPRHTGGQVTIIFIRFNTFVTTDPNFIKTQPLS